MSGIIINPLPPEAKQAKQAIRDRRDAHASMMETKRKAKKKIETIQKFDGAPLTFKGQELIDACERNIKRLETRLIPTDGVKFFLPSEQERSSTIFAIRLNRISMSHYKPDYEYNMSVEEAVQLGIGDVDAPETEYPSLNELSKMIEKNNANPN